MAVKKKGLGRGLDALFPERKQMRWSACWWTILAP